MTAVTVNPRMREVLGAPRGRRLRGRFRWSGWRVLSYGAAVASGAFLGQVFAMPPW
ncbi:hypothetical protein ABZ512_16735 [Nocardiopsis dassonvillei]|uniref:hypothetical protein n=1 Tax=Nocardiopsis dassonvillei TaxID=2014 RepID=UPI0033EE5C26